MRLFIKHSVLFLSLIGFIRGQTDTTVVVSGVSTLFTVDSKDPVVDWVYPDGGESFGNGANVTGTWTTSDDSPIDNPISILIATVPGETFIPIITQLPDFGSILFALPSINTAFARIKLDVVDAFGNRGMDYSQGYFTIGNPGGSANDTTVVVITESSLIIVDAVNPEVDLLFPVGSDSLPSGGVIDVSWTASDPSFGSTPIEVALATRIGDWFEPLTTPVANSSPSSITFPVIDTRFGRLRITAKDTFGNIGLDESHMYFIIGSPPSVGQDTTAILSAISPEIVIDAINPVVDLISPNGQEAILEGTGIPVTWTAHDDSLGLLPVDLSLATSIGGNFDVQVDSLPNDGFESVVAPDTVTDYARMRVTVRDHFGNIGLDESQDYFKIFQTGTGAITGNVRATQAAEGWLHIGLWYPGSTPDTDPPDQIRDSLYVVLALGDSVPYSFANLLPGTYTVQAFLDQIGSPTGGHAFCDGGFDFTGDSTGIQVVVNTVTQAVDLDLIRCPRLYPLAPEIVYGRPQYQSIEIAWRLDPEAVYYNVYRDTLPNASSFVAQLPVPDTVFVDTNIVSGHSYYYRIAAVNELGNEGDYSVDQMVWYHPIVGYWEAPTNGTTWIDASGLANHGTIQSVRDTLLNATPALWFNGQNTYVHVPESPYLNPPEITVEAIIYPYAWSGNNRILQKGIGDDQYLLEAEGDHLEFMVNAQSFSVMTPLPPVGEWMHVAGVYDGDSAYIYINYQEMNRIYVGEPLNTTSDPLYLGTKQPTSPSTDFFHGGISKIRIANVVVPPSDFLWFDASPAVPVNLQAIAGNRTIELSWAPNGEADLHRYTLSRATVDSTPQWIADVLAPDTSYVDTTVQNGVIYRYWLAAVDSAGHASQAAEVTGLRPNGPPVWSAPPDTSFLEDDTLKLDLALWIADDSDPDSTLSVTILGGNQIFTTNTGGMEFQFWSSPNLSDISEVFTFTVQDPWGATEQGSMSISVIPVNDAPVIINAPVVTATEDLPFIFHPQAEDVDQDPLVFGYQNLPSWVTWEGDSLTGSPGEGQLDTTFTLLVTDGQLGDTSQISIQVTPVNDAPVITSPTSLAAFEDQPVVYWPTAQDPEDSTLTFDYLLGPSWLLFQGDSIFGVPGEGDLDTIFSFRVTDGNLFDQAVVQVQVTPVNDPPQITMPDSLVFTEHQVQFYPLRATDPEDSSLVWMILSGPSWISLQRDSIGGIPPEGAVDTIVSVFASDGVLEDVVSIVVDVIPVNDPPVLTSAPSANATEDVLFEYTATATDPEGGSISISILNPPVWCNVDGASLIGVPTEGHLDTLFTVRLSDNYSLLDLPIPIQVTPVNDAPMIQAPDTVAVIYNQYFTYHVSALDPEDSVLTFIFANLPSWLTAAGDSLFGMPTLAHNDTTIHVVVYDGEYSDEQNIYLDLQYTDVDPQIMMDLLSGEFHGAIPLTVQADAQLGLIPDSLTLSYSFDAEHWLPATVTVETIQRALQDTFHLLWQSHLDIEGQFQPRVWIRSVLDPINPAQVAVIGPIAVDNFTGTVILDPTAAGQTYTNQADIPFMIEDSTGDIHSLLAAFSLDNGMVWQTCTVSDSGMGYGPEQYISILHWYTDVDLVNLDTLALLAINIFDGWEWGTGDTIQIHVDNQVLPLLISSGVSEMYWSESIQLNFSKPLNPLTISSGFILSPTYGNYSGFNYDLSADERTIAIHPDTGSWAGLESIGLSITTDLEDQWGNPFDGNGNGDPDGIVDMLTLAFTTRPTGDFDGDGAITFPDLIQFQQGWWANVVTTVMDLGPSWGSPPHLQPQRDGKVDFEDLMVFVQMWNWSAGNSRTLARIQIPENSPTSDAVAFRIHYPQRKPGDPLDETELILETQGVSETGALDGILQYDPNRLEFLHLKSGLPEGWILLQNNQKSQIHFVLADFNRTPVALNSKPCTFRFKVFQDGPVEIQWQADLRDHSGQSLVRIAGSESFDPLPDLPQDYALHPNYPNPFNPVTRIDFTLPRDGQVTLVIHDILGRKIRTLVDDTLIAGYHSITWDGKDGEGRSMATGIYLLSMTADDWSAIRKITLMK